MWCLLGQTRHEPSLVSDGNRKAVVLAAIHWWFCWKMMYSLSKSVMVFGRCQSLPNLSPCFLSCIHFGVMWEHITRKSGFYFSGQVLQSGITLSFSQSPSLWYSSCWDKCLTYLCLTALKRNQSNTFQLTKTTTILDQPVSKMLFRPLLRVSQECNVSPVQTGAGGSVIYST